VYNVSFLWYSPVIFTTAERRRSCLSVRLLDYPLQISAGFYEILEGWGVTQGPVDQILVTLQFVIQIQWVLLNACAIVSVVLMYICSPEDASYSWREPGAQPTGGPGGPGPPPETLKKFFATNVFVYCSIKCTASALTHPVSYPQHWACAYIYLDAVLPVVDTGQWFSIGDNYGRPKMVARCRLVFNISTVKTVFSLSMTVTTQTAEKTAWIPIIALRIRKINRSNFYIHDTSIRP